MPVTANTKVDANDFEKVIPLAQTAASITPINLKVDDGDVASKIMALQVAAGVPVAERCIRLDRQDWEKFTVLLQGKVNARTATITIATPAVVTLATHGFAINQAVKFTTTGALPTGIVAGTPYYVATPGYGAGAFQISATPGGASINTTGTQSGTQTVYPA